MIRQLITFFVLILIGSICQGQGSAIIQFEGERSPNTRTYICKLKKGDPHRLDNYLQSGTTNSEPSNNEKNFSPKEYEPRNNRKETRFLSDIYNIDEKKLKMGKEKQRQKYFDEKEKAYLEKREAKPKAQKSNHSSIKDFIPQRGHKTKLSKQFKLSARRIKEGQKRKVKAGNANLIIKFETREGNVVKSYITPLNTKIEPGKKYILKYYGNETKRKYFLEAATN